MTARRIILLILLLVLLATAGAAAWLYLNLPAIIASQGRQYLAQYGVESIEATQPRLANGEVHLDELVLGGQRDNAPFRIALSGLDLGYTFSSIALGRLDYVSIERLDVTVEVTPTASTDDPAQVLELADMLPASVGDLLPVEALAIDDLRLALTYNGLAPLEARGSVTIDRRARLLLDARWQGMDVALSVATQEAPLDMAIRLRARSADTDIMTLDASPGILATREWVWRLAGGLDIEPLRQWLARADVRAALPVERLPLETFDALAAVGRIDVAGTLRHADRIDPATFTDTLSGEFDVEGTSLRVTPDEQGGELAGALRGQLRLAPQRIQVVLSSSELQGNVPTHLLGIAQDTLATLDWQDTTRLSWQQAGPVTLELAPGGDMAADIPAARASVASGTSELVVDVSGMTLAMPAASPTEPDVAGQFKLAGKLRGKPLFPLSGSISMTGQQDSDIQALRLELAEPASSLSLALTGTGKPAQGTGKYRLETRAAQLAGLVERYKPLLPPQLTSGTLPKLRAGSARLVANMGATGWQSVANWQWRSQLEITDMALTYDTYTVDGLALKAAWRGLEQWQTVEPAQLAVQRIDVGFPVRELAASVSLPRATPPASPDLRLDALDMSLLGGRAFVPEPQTWNFASKRNSMTLQVEDLALADIVALQQNRQISAEGRLSGLLPVRLSGDRLIIDKGHVKAAAPGGVIRYRPDEASAALAGNSRELGMAMTLLGNFHYDVLSSEVALDEGGILLLALSLAGRNPQYEGGRAVNFNINLEQNIDPLLESLRVGGSVTRQLEKKRR